MPFSVIPAVCSNRSIASAAGTSLSIFKNARHDQKLFRKLSLILAVSILTVLTVTPAYASPSLSLNSNANYSLSGQLRARQSCSAVPPSFSSQACLGISSVPPPAFVSITGNSTDCSFPPPTNDPFAALRCRFVPNDVTVAEGGTVVWTNIGNTTHTVTANLTANFGLPSFASGPIFPRGTFSNTFNLMGIYHYYDSNYGQHLLTMRGIVNVTAPPPPPPPPMPSSAQVDLSGNVGWNVEGLSSTVANLLVSHQTSVSVPVGPIAFTPVTESGSFEQSISLSTRVESPGTASAIAESALTAFSSAFTGLSFATGGSTSLIQNMLLANTNQPVYTEWWVNGPLSNGSPVQILQGWSSVTGSENLDLGSTLGLRSAWIANSQLSQNVNVNLPNPSSPLSSSSSTASANLNLLWSYDKSSDLLLRTDQAANVTAQSTNIIEIFPQNCFPPSPACQPTTVTVTRDMSLKLQLALRLTSTNISFPTPRRNSQLTFAEMLASMPWMPLGFGGAVAGGVAGVLAVTIRKTKEKKHTGSAQNEPLTSPSTPS